MLFAHLLYFSVFSPSWSLRAGNFQTNQLPPLSQWFPRILHPIGIQEFLKNTNNNNNSNNKNNNITTITISILITTIIITVVTNIVLVIVIKTLISYLRLNFSKQGLYSIPCLNFQNFLKPSEAVYTFKKRFIFMLIQKVLIRSQNLNLPWVLPTTLSNYA